MSQSSWYPAVQKTGSHFRIWRSLSLWILMTNPLADKIQPIFHVASLVSHNQMSRWSSESIAVEGRGKKLDWTEKDSDMQRRWTTNWNLSAEHLWSTDYPSEWACGAQMVTQVPITQAPSKLMEKAHWCQLVGPFCPLCCSLVVNGLWWPLLGIYTHINNLYVYLPASRKDMSLSICRRSSNVIFGVHKTIANAFLYYTQYIKIPSVNIGYN